MKQIRITLSDEQHEKLKAKLQDEGQKNLEHSTMSGFSITLDEASHFMFSYFPLE